MDYEKAYKEALGRAKKLYEQGTITESLSYVFDELAESEDERVIKAQLDYWCSVGGNEWHGVPVQKTIAWLEKQSGQKPFDYENANIQQNDFAPKFKLGDWIVWKDKCYKVNDNGCGYELFDTNGLSTSLEYGTVDENARLWTIADAKDGDILSAYECIVVFKEIDWLNIRCYCVYHYLNHQAFYVDTLQNKTAFHPATKEQRELLFQKMKDDGYKWDTEKKELRNIETPSNSWTEDDEKNWLGIMDEIKANKSDAPDYDIETYDRFLSWLESLKHRLQ